jgi:anti-sigma factor RsiW
MSELLEHRECSESLGAYALGALPEVENERVRQHLASCRQCRAELEGLRSAVDALPASVPQIDPPPELKARLMEIVEAEAKVLQAAGAAADRPGPQQADRPAPQQADPAPEQANRPAPTATVRRRRRWLPTSIPSPGLALACACVIAIAIVVAIVSSAAGPGSRTIQAQLSGRLLAAGTRATLELSGTRARLVLSGLPAPRPGHVDELWVKRGAASPEPAGTFVVQSGSVQVARVVRHGDVVMLTVEPEPGTTAPTSDPLLVARA